MCAAPRALSSDGSVISMTAAVESNEIWLNLTTDATGRADKTVVVEHVARAEAQAIVIHAADNTRLACIELKM